MKPNDKTAPRSRAKVTSTVSKEMYEYLFEKAPVLRYKYSKAQIKEIILKFNELVCEEVINNRYGVELPIFNRQLFIAAYLGKNIKPSHKYQKFDYYNNADEIRHNYHTNGFKMKMISAQIPKKLKVKNSGIYKFSFYRTCRVEASKAFAANWSFYNRLDISKRNTFVEKPAINKDLSNYNELEI